MNSVCPACGVAVLPGYVRCPKCRAGLPLGRAKRTTADPGGTAVPQKGFPIAPVLVALAVAVAIILVFGIRSSSKKTTAQPPRPPEPIEATTVKPPARAPFVPAAVPAPAPPAPQAAAQDVAAAKADLEDTLHRQRLWGKVEIAGQRIDVRSGSCAAPAMRPLIEGKKALLRGAGLTKLRCLEQSGAVVFERDL
jgi:hypothetical protein